MDIKTLQQKYINREISVEEYIKNIFEKIKENSLNSFITLNEEKALEKAKKLDEKLKNQEPLGDMFGIPISLKDNIITKGLTTTAASDTLEHFVPLHQSTVARKIEESDAIIIGKTNMDELAMGGSGETSHFKAVINPFDKELIPGGSSSGSAVSVAAGEAVVSIGTDTGGSVRNPANFCNVVGFAGTYGAISRWGVISMANSLDRVGILGNNVYDVRELFKLVSGVCDHDFTSIEIKDFDEKLNFKDLKFAAINLKDSYNTDEQVKKNYEKVLSLLEKKGALVERVDLNLLDYINEVYTVIMSVEVSSNIARFDGIRYGESIDTYNGTDELFINNRSYFLGEEVQRRIALGDYFCSKEVGQKYYIQAMKIRNMIKKEMEDLLSKFDVFISPTNTNLPVKVGEMLEDANSSFNSGIFNTITNIANLPSISIPVEKDKLGSVQLISNRYEDYRLMKIAEMLEGELA